MQNGDSVEVIEGYFSSKMGTAFFNDCFQHYPLPLAISPSATQHRLAV